MEQPDHNKSQHETLATEVKVHAWEKKMSHEHHKKIDVRVEIGMSDCLRIISYCGLSTPLFCYLHAINTAHDLNV